MADKIRGITIEIGGDTSGLTKSLKGVNSEITSTQKQLKDVEKLLKLDPGNVELLKQKHQLLNKEVEETKTKVQELKNIQDKMDAAGVDKNSEQYQALQREIIATENSLKELEDQAGNSNVAVAAISAACDKVAAGAEKVAQKTAGLSTAAAGLLGSLGAAAYSAVTASDDLNTLAKQTGLSTEELQKMSYASDLIDVSVDDITGSLKKMKKNMDSTSADTVEAWQRIGVATKDSDGNLRDSTTVFYEALEGLSKVENETERDTLAMQLFGKSADSLAGIVDDGGAALKELGTQAEELGLIMDQETLDSLNAVNDEIDTLKANASATLAQTGAKAMEALLPVFDKVVEALSKVLEFIGSLDTETLEIIITILAVVAAISPLASAIGGIATAISTLLPILSGPVGIIALIVAAVVALTALIVENWDEIKAVLLEIWEKVKETFEKIKDKIVTIFTTIKEKVVDIFTSVKDKIVSIFTAIVDTAKNKINGVISLLNGAIDAINKLISGLNNIRFTMPKWLGGGSFGLNIPTIPNIPMLAKGGVLSSGSAIVGEAGPELLTMQNSKAVVQPLTATLDSSAMKALTGSQAVTNVNVEFTGSLAQLATLIHPYIKAETNRIGNSLIAR